MRLKNDAREYQLTCHGGLADAFTIYDGTAGVHRFAITSGGNVGVGKEGANRRLHVASDDDLTTFTGGSYGTFAIENSQWDNGDYTAMDFLYNGTNKPVSRIASKITSSGASLHFGVSNSYSTGITHEAVMINYDGNIRIGAGSIAVPKATQGGVDIDSGAYTVCIGGNVNSSGRTNATDKLTRITSPHRTNAEEPVMMFSAYNQSGNNNIGYGGGSSITNTVTQHTFYTSANTTTTNGTERLRITSSGNVDINGAPPWSVSGGNYRNLSISGEGASASGFLWLGNGAAATNADFDLGRVNFCNGGTIVARVIGSTQTSANDDGRLTFYTKETGQTEAERLRITSDGTVGINKTSPNAGLKLHVGGKARFDDDVQVQTGGIINTNSSQGQLTIQGGATYPGSGIKFAGGQGGATDQGEMIFYAGNATSLTERVRITIGGRLGVGSGANARAYLDVRESVNDTPPFNIGYNDGSFYRNLGTVGPNDDDGTNATNGGQYLHVKLRTVWNDTSMTMFRITGYYAYNDYTESYAGCYRYNHSSYRSNPYGQVVHNQKRDTLHSMYNTADSPGYLVLVLDSGTNYIGYMIEHIGAGGVYASYMQQDLEILEVERSTATDVWK